MIRLLRLRPCKSQNQDAMKNDELALVECNVNKSLDGCAQERYKDEAPAHGPADVRYAVVLIGKDS